MIGSDMQRDPVERLAEEFAERLRRGERPSLAEYTDRYPELADEIRDLFPALVVMEQYGSVAGPLSAPPAVLTASTPDRLGDFRILREVGRGGMGVVYEAVQESLGRHVALKVLPAGPRAQGTFLERFRREAQAAAKLHHTNIVPVFGVGETAGVHFYAMQYIHGQGLDIVLTQVRRLRGATPAEAAPTVAAATPALSAAHSLRTGHFAPRRTDPDIADVGPPAAPPASTSSLGLARQPEVRYFCEVARLAAQAADGLSYAHAQGVLHRDIKPSNLLIDTQGTLWIADFGLAKADDSDDLTGTGDLVGTLRYMAPERFRGAADARSDVYALGVTLYELLTLRSPYDDADRLRLVKRIEQGGPPRPRQLDPLIPRDLETVVLKAMAAEPDDRYATAGALAEDLRRVLTDRPVWARRHSLREQAWRWCRRNPAVASLTAVIALLMVVLTAGALVKNAELRRALTQSTANWRESQLQLWGALKAEAYGLRLSRREGQRFKSLDAIRRAVQLGRELDLPPQRFDELRNEAIAALALPDLYVERWWDGWPKGLQALHIAGDLETCARVEGDGTVSVRRVADDAELHCLPALEGTVSVHLSPDGRYLLQYQTATPFRGRLWDLSSDPPGIRLEESALGAYHCYRPDGQQIALTHRDGAISVYDPATGQRVYHLPPHAVVTGAWIELHPHAPFAAVSSYNHRDVLVRDLRSGAVVASLTPPWPGGGYANWHPAGRALGVGQGDGNEVRLYDFDPAAPGLTYRRSLPSKSGGGTMIAFNRAGDRAAVAGWGGTVSLIDFTTGRSLFEAPASLMGSPQFDASGRRLSGAVRIQEAKVGVWSVGDGRECRVLLHGRPPYPLFSPAVSPDGRLLAVNILAEGLVLFDLATNRELATIPFHLGPVGRIGSFLFEPSGALLTTSMDGCFRWPLRPDPSSPSRLRLGPPERLPFHDGGTIAASRDGRVVAQSMYNGYGMQPHAGGWILHPDRLGEPRRVMAGDSGSEAAVSPDGRWVAFGVHGSHVLVFEAATGREVWQSPTRGSHRCLFTADGRWLATEADGGRFYAVGTWEPGPQLGPGSLQCVSADSRLAVLVATEGYYRLVEVETGRELARIEDPERYPGLATFTPDGTRLVALTKDGLRVWDLRAIRRELSALGLDWDAPPFREEEPGGSRPPPAVEVVGAELLNPTTRAWWTLIQGTRRLLEAPDDLPARQRRAAAAQKLGWPGLATHDYSGILEQQPDHRAARFQRGLIALQQRRPTDALADFDDLLRRDPNHGSARYRRVQALIALERYREAAADLDLLIPKYPQDASLYRLRGQCRDRLGDQAGAEADLRKAVELQPDEAQAANNLAWHYVTGPEALRDPAKALPLAEKAVQLSPRQWTYHNTLGVVLYRLGRYAEAVKHLSVSLEHTAADYAAYDLYVLAMCHHRLGDAAQAKDCFDRAVRGQQQAQLRPSEVEELNAFRAEAATLLGTRHP